MASAEAVARYFLWLAASESEDEPVTHMRLQKLMYFAQGWALGTRGARLFDSAIEAWVHGPVVRDVYPKFADYRGSVIPSSEAAESPELTPADKQLVRWVWDAYGKYAAWRLREMSHREPPWRAARAGLPEDAASRAIIEEGLLREHFGSLREARARLGLRPEPAASVGEPAIPLEELAAEVDRDMAH